MASLKQRVTSLLRQAFPPPDRVLIRDEDGLIGRVISRRFDGLDPTDRLELIWKVLDAELSIKDQLSIVSILAITPREEKLHVGSLR
jgi:hypothetical protein